MISFGTHPIPHLNALWVLDWHIVPCSSFGSGGLHAANIEAFTRVANHIFSPLKIALSAGWDSRRGPRLWCKHFLTHTYGYAMATAKQWHVAGAFFFLFLVTFVPRNSFETFNDDGSKKWAQIVPIDYGWQLFQGNFFFVCDSSSTYELCVKCNMKTNIRLAHSDWEDYL